MTVHAASTLPAGEIPGPHVVLVGTAAEVNAARALLGQPVELRPAPVPKPDPAILKWNAYGSCRMDTGTGTVAADVTESRGGRWRWDCTWTAVPEVVDHEEMIRAGTTETVSSGGWEPTEETAKGAANRWVGRKMGLL